MRGYIWPIATAPGKCTFAGLLSFFISIAEESVQIHEPLQATVAIPARMSPDCTSRVQSCERSLLVGIRPDLTFEHLAAEGQRPLQTRKSHVSLLVRIRIQFNADVDCVRTQDVARVLHTPRDMVFLYAGHIFSQSGKNASVLQLLRAVVMKFSRAHC